jgi:hypothetical protein
VFLSLFLSLVTIFFHHSPAESSIRTAAAPGADVFLVLKGGATVVVRTSTDTTGHFALAVPDDAEYELKIAREGFRAKPVAISNAAGGRNLGVIALEISAVAESLVVSAAQVEIPLSTTSSSVTVLTGEDLARRQVESVADALRTVPTTVISSGGRGSLTSVFRAAANPIFLVLSMVSRQIHSAETSTSRTCQWSTSNGSKSSVDRRARSTDQTR